MSKSKARPREMTIVVPLHITFDMEDAEETSKRKLPPLHTLIEWLQENLRFEVDTESEGNPYGFSCATSDWGEAIPYSGEQAERIGVYPCTDGQRLNFTLLDPSDNVVEAQEAVDTNFAADLIRRFVILHGGDPDERGRGAQPGSITFVPVRAAKKSKE